MPISEGTRLLTPELHLVIAEHVLPRLGAQDLGRLASTCKELVALVNAQGPEVWQTAAASLLPCSHPAMQGTVSQLRSALSSTAASRRHMKAGLHVIRHYVSHGYSPLISPDSKYLAVAAGAQVAGTRVHQLHLLGMGGGVSRNLTANGPSLFRWRQGQLLVFVMLDEFLCKLVWDFEVGTLHEESYYQLAGLSFHAYDPAYNVSASYLSCQGGYFARKDRGTGRLLGIGDFSAAGNCVMSFTAETTCKQWLWHPVEDAQVLLVEQMPGGTRIRVVDLSAQRDVYLDDVCAGQITVHDWAPEAELLAVTYHPSADIVVKHLEDNTVAFSLPQSEDMYVFSLALSTRGHLLLPGKFGVRIYRHMPGQAQQSGLLEVCTSSRAFFWAAAWAPDGRVLAVYNQCRKDLFTYDSLTCTRLASLTIPGGSINSICWSPSGTSVLCSSGRGHTRGYVCIIDFLPDRDPGPYARTRSRSAKLVD